MFWSACRVRLTNAFVFTLAVFTCAEAAGAISLAKDARKERRVGPGVTHVAEFRSSGPVNINVLKIDLGNPNIGVETEKPKDQLYGGAKVTDLAQEENAPGHTAIAGINGDFWANSPRMFTPIGFFVSDGMIYNAPYPRSAFVLTEQGKPRLDVVTLKVSVKTSRADIAITRVNDPRTTDQVVLFTPPFGPAVGGGKSRHVALKLASPEFLPNKPVNARVTGIATGTSTPLGKDILVLSFPTSKADDARSFKKGDQVTMVAEVPEVNGVITYAVGGGPRLVRNGKVDVEYEEETMGRSFSYDRHPRTALGIGKDGKTLVLLAVDGRQPLVSVGQNLFELAEEMIRQGCSDAINLDGGGSTTMVVRGEVVNRPSDLQGPRTVANGLLVYSKAATGPLAELQIEAPAEPLLVPAGSRLELKALGYDANFNSIDLANSKLEWATDSQVGKVEQNGSNAVVILSDKAGSGKVRVSAPGTTFSSDIAVKVIPDFKIISEPDVLLLAKGEQHELEISAVASDESPLFLQDAAVKISATGSTADLQGRNVTGRQKGKGAVEVRIGAVRKQIPCFVDVFDATTLLPFDSAPTQQPTGANFDSEKTGVAIEPRNLKQGTASLAFSYGMTRGGTSKISVPVEAEVTSRPAKFALWIYGDGKEAWVRAEVLDILGRRFMLDFTDGSKGVFWKNEWRQVMVPADSLVPRPSNPGAKPEFPVTIKEVYLAQDQEALKASGKLLLDDFRAIYPPAQ